MTVKEYLGCLNNCVISDGMDVSTIRTVGFIDICDEFEGMIGGHSAYDISVSDKNLIVKVTLYGKGDAADMDIVKVISLGDSLEEHCGDKSEEETIERTISGIKENIESTREIEEYTPGACKIWEVALRNFENFGKGFRK